MIKVKVLDGYKLYLIWDIDHHPGQSFELFFSSIQRFSLVSMDSTSSEQAQRTQNKVATANQRNEASHGTHCHFTFTTGKTGFILSGNFCWS